MCAPEGGKKVDLSYFPVKELWERYMLPKKPNHICCACKKGENNGGSPNGMHYLSHNTTPSPQQLLDNPNLHNTLVVTKAVNIAASWQLSSSSPLVQPIESVSPVSGAYQDISLPSAV